MWQRNGVQPAGMEKHLSLRGILGEPKPLTEKEYAKQLPKYLRTKISHAKHWKISLD